MTDINEARDLRDDLFAFHINYNQAGTNYGNDYTQKQLYNGNISETYWRSASDNILRQYGYFYDAMNRLRDAVYIKPESNTKVTNAYDERLAYDANGNILELQRNGYRDADDNLPLEIDRLLYAYNPNSNQLRSVADYTQCLDGFRDGITANLEYDYDSYGNMTTDGNKGIGITYNHLNLPVLVEFGNGGKILYLYDASGVKLRKTVIDNNVATTTDYLSGFQYTNGVLSFFPTAEGYVKHTEGRFNYVYNYTDHLGNNRLSYTWDRQAQTVKIMEENNYYPFGLKQENYNVEKVDYKKVDIPGAFAVQLANVGRMAYQYKYNGKELQDELGLNFYDYGARNYDPAIGRWMNIDPLAEKSRRWSPFVYCYNNPLVFIDPDGQDPIYGKNFWGRTKLIGDDGKSDGKSYLVRGDVKREVKAATKANKNYSGDLTEGKNVMNVPTGGVMKDVVDSVADSEKSQRENGGHANKGDSNATRWDEGPAAIPFTDQNGNPGAKATLSMFQVNGKDTTPADASNVEFWWHVHPETSVNGLTLGASNPSGADGKGQSMMQGKGFKGNSFVIGVRTGTVTFFTSDGKGNAQVLMTVSLEDFKKMGGQ